MDRAVVAVDGGYFRGLSQYLYDRRGKRLDLEKLSKKVTEGIDHIRTKFYYSSPFQSEKPTREEKERYRRAQKFQYAVNRIRNHEFIKVGRVRPVHFHCPQCDEDYIEPKQKGVDVGLALDLVNMAKKKVAQVFILVSGDEDFSRAVEMAQEELCNVIVYFCSDSEYGVFGSKKLGNTASDRVRMDLDFLEKCAL